ncbi:MAG TPA: response regulator transcription factor [Jatrophihabitantaceae bacterium]|jgi:DNA-binding NarL/FixJ family response regulator
MVDVVVIEDHLLVAETVRAALATRGITAELVAPTHPVVLLARVCERAPSLVLLDLDLGSHGDGTDLIAPLAAAGIRALVVSGTPDRERIARAFEAGAFGYQPKSDGIAALADKAVAALAGDAPLDDLLRHTLRDELMRVRAARTSAFAPFATLTERERATLTALSRGLSVHSIAAEWVVSEATVRSHVRGVLCKLAVPSQLAAVALALRSGWLAATA